MKWITNLIKGLLWFLINIPLLGIPHIIKKRRESKIDDGEWRYVLDIGVCKFTTKKKATKALDDLGVTTPWKEHLLDNSWMGCVEVRVREKQLALLRKHTRDGTLYVSGSVFDNRKDWWVHPGDLDLVA